LSLLRLRGAGLICVNQPFGKSEKKMAAPAGIQVMSIATIMVYVDPAQQAEEQVRVARSIADKFDASLTGISAFAVEPNFVAEGVIIEETTPEDLKRMKSALAEKEQWFRQIVAI
jgi:hypothetical protein